MDNEMIVFSTGVNGDATYSILTKEGRKPVYTKMKLGDLVKSIVKNFPDLSGKISKYFREDFSGDFPKEIDLSKLDPSPRAELIESIAENYAPEENKV